ncbi:glycosyltransferase family 2 protein, partial [Acinetobacter stercoris]|uniref:glycosyltransferase family 2 protein n=1 Tax=Acinetobacter stercoris TaxID=2126983 RepID=UPI000EFD65A6
MISIVVPVYNGEKFIEKNFLSLVNQDNNTFEVIYINDGSIDNTAEKIEILIKNYSNFRLISTPNSGVMAARKQGVEVAKYDFVTFLDIDDVLDSNFVSVFLNYCKDNKFEILVTNFRLNKNNNLKDIVRFQPGIYSSSDFIKYLCVNGGWELCGKVYKKELFDNIIYPNKVTIGEDALIFFQLVFYAYEIKVLNEYVYT